MVLLEPLVLVDIVAAGCGNPPVGGAGFFLGGGGGGGGGPPGAF